MVPSNDYPLVTSRIVRLTTSRLTHGAIEQSSSPNPRPVPTLRDLRFTLHWLALRRISGVSCSPPALPSPRRSPVTDCDCPSIRRVETSRVVSSPRLTQIYPSSPSPSPSPLSSSSSAARCPIVLLLVVDLYAKGISGAPVLHGRSSSPSSGCPTHHVQSRTFV